MFLFFPSARLGVARILCHEIQFSDFGMLLSTSDQKKISPHMLSTFLSLLSFSERIHFHVKRDYLSVWTAFCSIPLLSVNISCVSCHFMYAAAYSIIWIGLAGHRWRNYVFLSRWKIMYFVYVFLTYEYTTSMTCPSNRQTGRQADRYRANDHAAIISVE